MAGDITRGRRGALARRFHGRSGLRGRLHVGDNLVEKRGARVRQLLLAPLAVAERMFREARLADHLRHVVLNHAGDGVIQQKAAARAVIVDQVPESFSGFGHVWVIAPFPQTAPLRDYTPLPRKNPWQCSGNLPARRPGIISGPHAHLVGDRNRDHPRDQQSTRELRGCVPQSYLPNFWS